MATTTTRPNALCVCGCYERWHQWRYKNIKGAFPYCLSPDCPCRKFEPAGGVA